MECRNQNVLHRGRVLSGMGELRSRGVNSDTRFGAQYVVEEKKGVWEEVELEVCLLRDGRRVFLKDGFPLVNAQNCYEQTIVLED